MSLEVFGGHENIVKVEFGENWIILVNPSNFVDEIKIFEGKFGIFDHFSAIFEEKCGNLTIFGRFLRKKLHVLY